MDTPKYNPMQTVKREFFAMRNGIIADTYRKAGIQNSIRAQSPATGGNRGPHASQPGAGRSTVGQYHYAREYAAGPDACGS